MAQSHIFQPETKATVLCHVCLEMLGLWNLANLHGSPIGFLYESLPVTYITDPLIISTSLFWALCQTFSPGKHTICEWATLWLGKWSPLLLHHILGTNMRSATTPFLNLLSTSQEVIFLQKSSKCFISAPSIQQLSVVGWAVSWLPPASFVEKKGFALKNWLALAGTDYLQLLPDNFLENLWF